jgi:hypothetical protein
MVGAWRAKQCQWLDGEDWRSFIQCEAMPIEGPEGAVWCQDHRRRVYVPGSSVDARSRPL